MLEVSRPTPSRAVGEKDQQKKNQGTQDEMESEERGQTIVANAQRNKRGRGKWSKTTITTHTHALAHPSTHPSIPPLSHAFTSSSRPPPAPSLQDSRPADQGAYATAVIVAATTTPLVASRWPAAAMKTYTRNNPHIASQVNPRSPHHTPHTRCAGFVGRRSSIQSITPSQSLVRPGESSSACWGCPLPNGELLLLVVVVVVR